MKKNIIFTIAIIAVLIIGGVVWVLHQKQEQSAPAELPQQETSQQEQPVASEAAQTNNQEQVSEEPQPTIDTSDWKTYRNEEYGFSIKYPGDWQAELSISKTEKRPGEVDVPQTIRLIMKKKDQNFGDEMNSEVKKSSIVIGFTDWFDITHNDFSGNDSNTIPVKLITIGGRTAIIPDNKVETDVPTDYELFMGSKDCRSPHYIMTLKPAPEGWGQYNTILVSPECEDVEIAKKIIESIKFLK